MGDSGTSRGGVRLLLKNGLVSDDEVDIGGSEYLEILEPERKFI
jgi:hypothetical protein